MHRSTLALVAALVAVAALPVAADAARVTIRVEGKTRTIFGKAPKTVEASTPLEALRTAGLAGEFYVHTQETSFGTYVDQIGAFAAAATTGWVFKVDGASPPVGADTLQLEDGDRLLWYWADFGSGAGPRTLALRSTSRSCYAAFAEDDAGTSRPAGAVRVWIAGVPRFRDADGRFCLPRHVGRVHVTKAAHVRSNALA